MRKTTTLIMAALVTVAMSAPAFAVSDNGVDTEPIVRMFNPDGSASGEIVGKSSLIRRDGSLKATAQASGLIPGGVYTFWWVVIPDGGTFPADAFVALGGSKVVGSNGRATARMDADYGQSSITGFLIPFPPLDFELQTAEVHVEIAYHGQASDAGDDLATWLSDFWTGTACPDTANTGEVNAVGQPHCPVYIVAIHN